MCMYIITYILYYLAFEYACVMFDCVVLCHSICEGGTKRQAERLIKCQRMRQRQHMFTLLILLEFRMALQKKYNKIFAFLSNICVYRYIYIKKIKQITPTPTTKFSN